MIEKGLEVFDFGSLSAGTILDSLADGAYITDTERNILFWNQAAERITGWPKNEVVGRSCRDNILVHIDKDGHPLCGREHCPLHRAMVTGERTPEAQLVFAQSRDGRRVPVEVTVSPIRDRRGNTVGGIEVFRDLDPVMQDLNAARIIQERTLDAPLPDDPRLRIASRYVPAGLIGGDFYRVERLDEDRYALMVADVTGHGVASALYSIQIRSLWEECRAELGHPTAFAASLNRRLHTLTSGDDYFATAVHAVVNAATGRVDYVRAGHPPPLLFRAHAVDRLEAGGPGLGLFEEAPYKTGSCTMKPGDTLLLYTDGAVEVPDAQRNELEVDGLIGLLQATDLSDLEACLSALEKALLAYCHTVRLPDDLTLLALHRR